MTAPEGLEPAHRIVPEPTDDEGRLLGWRAKDVPDDELSDDDYAAQFTRHEPYANGGLLPPGYTFAYNGTSEPEPVTRYDPEG